MRTGLDKYFRLKWCHLLNACQTFGSYIQIMGLTKLQQRMRWSVEQKYVTMMSYQGRIFSQLKYVKTVTESNTWLGKNINMFKWM